MARLIGLDVGGVRTGVASTDDLKLICSPLETVKTSELMAKLRALTDATRWKDSSLQAQPHRRRGHRQHPHIDRVVADLKKLPPLTIHFVDEGHTHEKPRAFKCRAA